MQGVDVMTETQTPKSDLKAETDFGVGNINSEMSESFRQRLAQVIGDEKPFVWAKRAGIPSATFTRIWKEGAIPKSEHLLRIADYAGVSVDWLLGRESAPVASIGDEFALVPRLAVRAAAGAGAINYEVEELPDAMLAFRRDWLHQRGIDPRNAAVITAYGDSMEPTIRHGDALLVNTAINQPRAEGIYVVRVEDMLLVKRVAIGLDHITLISDNPAIKDEVITKDRLSALHLVGRVVWFGREI